MDEGVDAENLGSRSEFIGGEVIDSIGWGGIEVSGYQGIIIT